MSLTYECLSWQPGPKVIGTDPIVARCQESIAFRNSLLLRFTGRQHGHSEQSRNPVRSGGCVNPAGSGTSGPAPTSVNDVPYNRSLWERHPSSLNTSFPQFSPALRAGIR
jgi:hypothetical protein